MKVIFIICLICTFLLECRAESLLTLIDDGESSGLKQCSSGVISCHKVHVNFDALRNANELELLGGLLVKRSSVTESDVYISATYKQDQPFAVDALFVYGKNEDDWVSGDVTLFKPNHGQQFSLEPCDAGKDCFVWMEIDTSKWTHLEERLDLMLEESPPNKKLSERDLALLRLGQQDQTTNANISVTVYVTKQVMNQYGANMLSFITKAIEETNQGYRNSLVPITMKLHCLTTFSKSDTDFKDMTDALNQFTPQNANDYQKTRFGADLAVLISHVGGYCGLSWFNSVQSGRTFAVVESDCATGYFSFGHEIAHMFGCAHNPESSQNPTYKYGHGFLLKPPINSGYRSILAYEAKGYGSRINYYSNPNVKFQDIPTGSVRTNFNAKVLTDNRFLMQAVGTESTQCPDKQLFTPSSVSI